EGFLLGEQLLSSGLPLARGGDAWKSRRRFLLNHLRTIHTKTAWRPAINTSCLGSNAREGMPARMLIHDLPKWVVWSIEPMGHNSNEDRAKEQREKCGACTNMQAGKRRSTASKSCSTRKFSRTRS